jgi:hypothetical protein
VVPLTCAVVTSRKGAALSPASVTPQGKVARDAIPLSAHAGKRQVSGVWPGEPSIATKVTRYRNKSVTAAP